MFTDIEKVAWTAGIIEGEGCLQKSGVSTMYLQVGMTDKDVIDRLQEYWGGFISKRNYDDKPWKSLWIWTLTPKNGAIELTEAILPYLGERRSQVANECLAFARQSPRSEIREKRRQMVKKLMDSGAQSKEIADTMGVSRSYVKTLKKELRNTH